MAQSTQTRTLRARLAIRALPFARKLAVRTGFRIGSLSPVRRRVVLATSHLDRISGNLAAIQQELAARRPPVRTVVLATRLPGTVLGRIRALADAVRAGYHLATARVFVIDDYYFPMYVVPRRQGTTAIQVWHACGAFKKFGYSVLDKSFGADEEFVSRVAIHSNYDLCLVSAMRFAPFYAQAFRQPLEVFASRYGIPRTDVFFDRDRIELTTAAIRRRYPIPAGRRVILYAPTFRGETIRRARSPEDLDLAALHRVLGEDHVVLLRLHPFVRARMAIDPDLRGFVVDASDYPDINELMLVSDVLITDYSSAIYEFSLLERPIVFFAPDHQAYEDERGFYFDFRREAPGPIFETTQEMAAYLRAGEFDLERVRAFREASFDVADGHATERLVDEVVLPGIR